MKNSEQLEALKQDVENIIAMADNNPSILITTLRDTTVHAYQLGLSRATEIAKEHKCGWDTGCLDEGGDGETIQGNSCAEPILDALEAERKDV